MTKKILIILLSQVKLETVTLLTVLLFFCGQFGKTLDLSPDLFLLQLNLSTTATLGTEESGRCGEVAVMGR